MIVALVFGGKFGLLKPTSRLKGTLNASVYMELATKKNTT